MMIHDFFLVERALQVQRLRATKAPYRINIPGSISRLNHSAQTVRLFRSIDRISEIPLDGKPKKLLGRQAAPARAARPTMDNDPSTSSPTDA
ncbi:MAG: hypothetical protein FJ295_08005 [Planctomycetes bacterium]|nr:hypothetical protein [Planctomycetota bacterium]